MFTSKLDQYYTKYVLAAHIKEGAFYVSVNSNNESAIGMV